MTSRPRLRSTSTMLRGVVAVALFVVLAVVFLGASFGDATGFPNGANITASIGYAMFNLFGIGGEQIVESEGFLVAFEIIDLVLVAALAAAVMLARREEAGAIMTPLRADGGEPDETTTDGGDE
ncbi:proton-conducting membrane transporter [Halomicrococcus sp. NG-SE-24]|uniref:proton-conducting membrane transporter n=1 Tax=Halomicrococcus sp. NG-SE-24 TaxID=3436928 RepID=UPI003D99CAA1